MFFLVISNIHNFELCEDQNTGNSCKQSELENTGKQKIFLCLNFFKALLKYKKAVLFVLITTAFYCYSSSWQDKSPEVSNPAV